MIEGRVRTRTASKRSGSAFVTGKNCPFALRPAGSGNAHLGGMKTIALFIVSSGLYLHFTQKTSAVKVAQVVTGQELAPLTSGPKVAAPAPSNALKRPIDRTHEVLGQVAKRNGVGEF